MGLIAQMHLRMMMAILLLLFIPVLASCKTVYTTKHFSFPPGSMPHQNDWQYVCLVVVSSKQPPITKISQKNIQIKIYDKNKGSFLDDSFKVTSASIRVNYGWEKFDEIQIELLEVGNEYARDSYNQDLLRTGPKRLLELKYQYNKESKRFERVN